MAGLKAPFAEMLRYEDRQGKCCKPMRRPGFTMRHLEPGLGLEYTQRCETGHACGHRTVGANGPAVPPFVERVEV